MTRRETYLDWNATAPLRPEAAAAMPAALARCGNPSSVHRWGRAARQRSSARARRWRRWSARQPDGVIFTSGGTEANHLALLGSGRERVLVSAVEHNSVLQAVPAAETHPGRSRTAIVDLDGARPHAAGRSAPGAGLGHAGEQRDRRRAAGRARSPRSRTRMARCSIATRCRPPARLPLDAAAIGADLVSLSAHKLGGPPGIGALVVTGGAELGAD